MPAAAAGRRAVGVGAGRVRVVNRYDKVLLCDESVAAAWRHNLIRRLGWDSGWLINCQACIGQAAGKKGFSIAHIRVQPRRVLITLVGIIVLMGIATMQGLYLRIYTQPSGWVPHYIYLFNPDGESNVLVAFTGALMLVAAMLSWAVASSSKTPEAQTGRWPWGGLSCIFIYMTVDEIALLHEQWEGMGRQWLESLGNESSWFLSRSWIVVAMSLVVLVGIVYLPFLWRLNARTRGLFIASGMVFVGAAVGLEVLGGYVAAEYGYGLEALLLGAVEDLCEMLGVVIFIYAILDYIGRTFEAVTVVVADRNGRDQAPSRPSN